MDGQPLLARVGGAVRGELRRGRDGVAGFAVMFGLQLVMTSLAAFSTRAIALGLYGPTVSAQVVLAGVSFVAVHRIAGRRCLAELMGFAIGAGAGAAIGIAMGRLTS